MSAHDLARVLPDLPTLRERCRALAVLDAILSPEGEWRHHCFDAHWAPDEEMASMRDGMGNAWSIVFGPAGAFLRGFDHESRMNLADGLWPGLLDGLPQSFAGYAAEPAFSREDGTLEATVCLWREDGDDRWHLGELRLPDLDDADGADLVFEVLADGSPQAYRAFAQDCYETDVDLDAVREVLALRPLSEALVRRVSPDVRVADLADDLVRIGYPVADGW